MDQVKRAKTEKELKIKENLKSKKQQELNDCTFQP